MYTLGSAYALTKLAYLIVIISFNAIIHNILSSNTNTAYLSTKENIFPDITTKNNNLVAHLVVRMSPIH